MIQKVKKGTAYQEEELRIGKVDGSFIWCKIRASTQFDEDGAPYKAVGLLLISTARNGNPSGCWKRRSGIR
jgi:putative two-component system response regulator